jgi:Zn-dependent protease
MDQRTKRILWVVAGVIVFVALYRSHHITEQEVIIFCVIVPSIILHEVSHGWVANAFGDDTAKRAGRLTLNPIAHVDPVGTLIVPALLSLAGAGVFGWAKPVPVNTGRLRSPRNQGVLVSLAGPATNAVLAALAAIVFIEWIRPGLPPTSAFPTGAQIVFYIGLVNVWLCIFNLIPIPPLDGSVLLERLLPARYWPTYLKYRQYTMPILLGLVLLNFFLYPHGPITWLFDQLFNWWANVLGIHLVTV